MNIPALSNIQMRIKGYSKMPLIKTNGKTLPKGKDFVWQRTEAKFSLLGLSQTLEKVIPWTKTKVKFFIVSSSGPSGTIERSYKTVTKDDGKVMTSKIKKHLL